MAKKKTTKRRKVAKPKAVVVKKCMKCGVPMESFVSKYLFGIKPSAKKKGYCNKCIK